MRKRRQKATTARKRRSPSESAKRAGIKMEDESHDRLRHAEHMLHLLAQNELPRVRELVFNSRCLFRAITDPRGFAGLPSITALQRTSRPAGFIKMSLEKSALQATLFYDQQLHRNEALLFSRTLGEVTALAYAALGLDVSSMFSLNEERSLQARGSHDQGI